MLNRRWKIWEPACALTFVLACGGVVPSAAQSAEEKVEALAQELATVRAELAELKAEMRAREAAERFAELERKVDVLADELERREMGEGVFRRAEKSEHGLGVAASKVYQVEQGLSIGGYGEALYQRFDSTRDDGAPAGRDDQLDFLRGVLYVGYKLSDRWVFNSEIEFEHASTGEEGEAALEFAYLDHLWKPQVNLRAGLLLVPMGFVNELHEPPLFLGARRPDVERNLLPATWRENGFGLFGDLGPFTYRTYVLNGLAAEGFSASGIRGGRQDGSEAVAEDLAWVGRIDYTGRPGLLAGVSAYVGDSGQTLADAGGAIGARTSLVEGHLEWKRRGFELRALGVRGEIDDVARLNRALGLAGGASIGEELAGGYVQLGYDVLASRAGRRALIPYVRWETFDTQKKVPAGFARDPARDVDLLTVGLAFKPLEQLIFKADYQDYENGADSGVDQFNVAIGYLF